MEDDIQLFPLQRSMFSQLPLFSQLPFSPENFFIAGYEGRPYSKLCSIFTNDLDCLNNEITYRETGNHAKRCPESTSFCLCHCDLDNPILSL